MAKHLPDLKENNLHTQEAKSKQDKFKRSTPQNIKHNRLEKQRILKAARKK